jgi:hypothetical protein
MVLPPPPASDCRFHPSCVECESPVLGTPLGRICRSGRRSARVSAVTRHRGTARRYVRVAKAPATPRICPVDFSVRAISLPTAAPVGGLGFMSIRGHNYGYASRAGLPIAAVAIPAASKCGNHRMRICGNCDRRACAVASRTPYRSIGVSALRVSLSDPAKSRSTWLWLVQHVRRSSAVIYRESLGSDSSGDGGSIPPMAPAD